MSIFKKIIEFFTTDPYDPVKYCATYKKYKCSHVDGYLCEPHKCEGFRQAGSNVDLRVLLRAANQVTKRTLEEL